MKWIIELIMIVGILSIIKTMRVLGNDRYISALIFFIISVVAIVSLGIIALKLNKEIPAIEVYRGNTTLQITYQDSVPIDTIVVYKNKL